MEAFGVLLRLIISNIVYVIPVLVFVGYMRWWWKRNKRRVKTLLIQEDRNIVDKTQLVETHYIGERKIGRPAWLMFHKLLFPQGNRLTAIVTERDCIPLDPFSRIGDDEIKKLGDVQAIAREHYRNDREKVSVQETNKMIVYILGMMVAVIAILIFFVVGIPYVSEKFAGA